MSVLVYVDSFSGKISKNQFEAVYYGSKIGSVTVITAGNASDDALAQLGTHGASKVLRDSSITTFDAQQITRLIANAATELGAKTIVISHDIAGKSVAPRLSARLKAGFASGATALPNGDQIRVNVFSGKAMALVNLKTATKVISVLPNSLKPEANGAACSVENYNGNAGSAGITIKAVKKPEGAIPLPEAELVVSAGRGLKGPENWGIVTDLAEALGAATACSRPVSDIGWRPHHEHVGQTGVAIRPNLYIAAGISGAIQHLAGVNGSKTIVVINTDAEAPFFKAADYGIVGDAFEVLPKLTEAVKKFKAAH
jgi:electron transfer flavoprotein alpha subunit